MSHSLILVALLVSLACACKSTKTPERVIVVSLRGLSGHALDDWLALRNESAFQMLANKGYRAVPLNPIPCAETAPAMATFETGAYPSRHGIVGNRFRIKGTSLDSIAFGYTSNFACETVWEAAARQGKKVIRIGSLFLHGRNNSPASIKTLAQANAQQNRGYPRAFVTKLESAIGFPPGGPDFDGYHSGRLDEKTIIEQIEQELNYLTSAVNFCLENEEFDLLMIDYPVFDRFGHPFYLKDSRQQNYGDEEGRKRTRFENYLKDAFARCDKMLQLLLEKADSAAVIVTSDYGFFAAHSRLALNKLLADAGLRVGNAETSEVIAITSSISANIYLNLAGREPKGAVLPQDYEATVEKIMSACRNYRDAATGEHVFDEVRRFSELPGLKLDHDHAGDVWVRLKPGYTFRSDIDPAKPLVDQPRFLGEHGYAPAAAQAKGIFLSFGPLAMPTVSQEVDAVDVAATVSALLGIAPPEGAQGRNVLSRN